MLLSQFPLTFHHIHNTMPCFITLLMTILVLIGMVYSRVPWEYIFKLNAFAAASEFCEWFQAGIDVYIPHHNYQVRPHLSPWFSAACTAVFPETWLAGV